MLLSQSSPLQNAPSASSSSAPPMGGRRLRDTGDTSARPSASEQAPLVSVLLFCRNSVKTLPRALDSAIAQTYANKEIIVVDGASDDGTVDLLRQRDEHLDYWVSEPDGCATDGQNKTLTLMRGEYFFFINADDWVEPDYIENCLSVIQEQKVDFVFGDVDMYRDGVWDKRSHGRPDFANRMLWHHAIPTISVFYHRRFYEVCGPVDPAYATASDYEWFLRALSRGLTGAHDPRIVAHMTHGGRSAPDSWSVGLKVALHPEGRNIRIAYGQPPLLAYLAHAEDVARFVASQALTSLGLASLRNYLPKSIRR